MKEEFEVIPERLTDQCADAGSLPALAGEPLRLDAYFYSFNPTGVPEIDLILSAVACAGKAYHHTDGWTDEYEWGEPHEGKTPEEWIQSAAEKAAKAWKSLPAPVQES